MTDQMQCPHCGVESEEGDRFCSACGESLNETGSASQAQSPTQPTPIFGQTTSAVGFRQASLEQSAKNWQALGIVFLLLALGGAIALGITLAPQSATTDTFGNATTETDAGVGWAIGVGVFVGSLVTILPYFFFSRVLRTLAQLFPSEDESVQQGTSATGQGTPPESDGWS